MNTWIETFMTLFLRRILNKCFSCTFSIVSYNIHFSDILEDVKEECSKYGIVRSLEIPRPIKGVDVPGCGKVKIALYNLVPCVMQGKQILHVNYIYYELHWWCNGYGGRLKCGRLWIIAPGQTRDYQIGLCWFSAKHC
jgi:hypothetical protein